MNNNCIKVAILAPITWRTPPRNYGPWEQVASVLTEALVNLGVDVTLFATGDAVTQANLESVCERPLGEYPGNAKVWECLHISHLMERAEQFNIIHNHFDYLPLTYSRLIAAPIITTIHGFSSEEIIPVFEKYNQRSSYVSISDSDRHPKLQYLDTVYNGIDEKLFQFNDRPGDYLLFFARIHPHKGAHEAIQIARQANKKLVICGLIQDVNYYREKVFPFIDNSSVVYKGNAGPADRNELMRNAVALLHPISFEEPFGLSVAEAQLCGTPVIAFNRGSMKEIIIDRKTGFLVNTVTEAVTALSNITQISRLDCRQHAMSHFSSQVMGSRYLQLYKRILNAR